jgi:hypothetical protein
LDGEGTFYVKKNDQIAVMCSNTHKPSIYWLKEMFGGSVHYTDPKKPHHRRLFTWQVVANDAVRVCSAVAVHLKQKVEQCLLLMAVKQTMSDEYMTMNGVPADVKAERRRLAKLCTESKHVAWD